MLVGLPDHLLIGVIGIELDEPTVVPGRVAAQAATALKYLSDLLEDAGSGIDKVVKTTILLTDMQGCDAVNVEYKKSRGLVYWKFKS